MAASSEASDQPPHGSRGLDLDEARRLYDSGLSLSEVGRRLEVSKGYLSVQFARAGIPVRRRGRNSPAPEPTVDVDELVRLRETGATFARIGDVFGIAPGYARVRYRRAKQLLPGDGEVSSAAPARPPSRPLAARRREFFADFVAQVVARRPDLRMPARQTETSWLSWGWGPFGSWCITAPRARLVRIEARIDTLDEGLNQQLFDELVAERDVWSRQIAAPVSCEPLDGHRSSRISASREGHFLEDDETRDLALAWSVSTYLDLHDALDSLLRRRARELRAARDATAR